MQPIDTHLNCPSPMYTPGGSRRSPMVQKIFDSAKKLDPRRQLKPGSRRASTLTVITSMVGGGTLALPYAMERAGLAMTIFYFLLTMFMCAWSAYALILIGSLTNAHSYYDIALFFFGKRWAVFVELLIVANLALAGVAYMTMVKNLLPKALVILVHKSDEWDSPEFLLPMVAALIIAPLALMKRVSALRYTSLVGFTLILYLTVTTIVKYFQYCNEPYGFGCFETTQEHESVWDNAVLVGGIRGHLYTIPVIISSMAAHPTVLPIYIELHKRSPGEMWRVILIGLSITTVIYIVLSVFGYFTFLDKTRPNYLLNDYHHDTSIIIAAIGLCLVCSLAIPLMMHAARRSITTLVMPKMNTMIQTPLLNDNYGPTDPESSPESGEEGIGTLAKRLVDTPDLAFAKRRDPREVKRAAPKAALPTWAHWLITLGLIALCTTVALFMENIGVVLAFLGASTLPMCCYIFPAICIVKLKKTFPDDLQDDNLVVYIVVTSAVFVAIASVCSLLQQFGAISK